MILSFSATRNGLTLPQAVQVCKIIKELSPDLIVHGGCTGGDENIDYIAFQFGISRRVRPCNLKKFKGVLQPGACIFPTKNPRERNLDIVQDGDTITAYPKGEKEQKRGSGTWQVIRMAKKIGKPLLIVYPNGRREWAT